MSPKTPPKTGGAPPPPPLPAAIKKAPAPPLANHPEPPAVASTGPAGAFLVELLINSGSPFKDHWAYWVGSHSNPSIGVRIHATGDVRNGFKLESQRSHDLVANPPTARIPLQWVDAAHFDERAMLNGGQHKLDDEPVCGFEVTAYKIEAPGKTLNAVDDDDNAAVPGKKITQRDCQTWIVESANQLAEDGIFSKDIAAYLHAIRQ